MGAGAKGALLVASSVTGAIAGGVLERHGDARPETKPGDTKAKIADGMGGTAAAVTGQATGVVLKGIVGEVGQQIAGDVAGGTVGQVVEEVVELAQTGPNNDAAEKKDKRNEDVRQARQAAATNNNLSSVQGVKCH